MSSCFACLIDGEPGDEPRGLEEEDGGDGEGAAHAEGLQPRQDGERAHAEGEDVRQRGHRDGHARVLHRRRHPLSQAGGLLPLAQGLSGETFRERRLIHCIMQAF